MHMLVALSQPFLKQKDRVKDITELLSKCKLQAVAVAVPDFPTGACTADVLPELELENGFLKARALAVLERYSKIKYPAQQTAKV